MSAPGRSQAPTLWAGLRRLAAPRRRPSIAESADALNAMNVFPVSDSDTGTNLRLTLAGIAQAVPDVNRASLDAIVQAAILSAHGNSGAILAEMFTSVCRALEQQQGQLRPHRPGRWSPYLLRTVANAARRAVARPVAGTILTVADAAADAAEDRAGRLTRTTRWRWPRRPRRGAGRRWRVRRHQLAVLAAAGVVGRRRPGVHAAGRRAGRGAGWRAGRAAGRAATPAVATGPDNRAGARWSTR